MSSPITSRLTGRIAGSGSATEYDIFVSKLSSKKEKHQKDLRVLALKLDKETAMHRLLNDGKAFLDDPKLRPQILESWRFIFQEPLFPS
jgi:hypothetical protein